MCYVVLKCIECSATVMWLWWSCNAYILQSLCDIYAKNGMEMLIIYNMADRSGDGLVMTKSVRICTYFTSLTQNNDGLNAMCYLIVHIYCPCVKNKCSY